MISYAWPDGAADTRNQTETSPQHHHRHRFLHVCFVVGVAGLPLPPSVSLYYSLTSGKIRPPSTVAHTLTLDKYPINYPFNCFNFDLSKGPHTPHPAGGARMASAFITRLLGRYVGAPGVTGFSLSFVDVPFQVADHVRLAGDGDGTHDTVVVSHVSPRRLERVRTKKSWWVQLLHGFMWQEQNKVFQSKDRTDFMTRIMLTHANTC